MHYLQVLNGLVSGKSGEHSLWIMQAMPGHNGGKENLRNLYRRMNNEKKNIARELPVLPRPEGLDQYGAL
jgi:hypothetical protein